MIFKPMTKAHLETETLRPSHAESRELLVENDFTYDYAVLHLTQNRR